MIRRIVLSLAFFVVIAFNNTSPTLAVASDSPESVVSTFQERLVDVMKVADQLSVKKRFDQLVPAVDDAFHMPLMTQIAVGSYWKNTAEKERKKAVQAFKSMSVSTLATLFDGYSGEVFEHQTNTPGPSKTIIVKTDLIKSDGSRIQIAYVTKEFKSGWRIIDIIVDGGISELKVRRSEYRQVLKTSGMTGLINLLEEKARELMSESNAS